MQNQKSAIGLDGNIASALGYPIGIIALILIFMEKDNKFVRFHAIQSLLWGLVGTVAIVVVVIIGLILTFALGYVASGLGIAAWVIMMLAIVGVILGLLGGAIFAAIKAYGGNEFKLPIVGNMAQKWV